MSKPKAPPQVDPSQAVNQQLQAQREALAAQEKTQREALAFQEKYTPLNTNTNLGIFGGTKQSYDPTTRTTTSTATYNPLVEQGLNQSLEQGVNFDELLKKEQQRVQDVYQKPQEEQSRAEIQNLFGELGQAGRYSTRGQSVLGRAIAEQNKQKAMTNYELGQQAENNLMNRIVNKFNLFYTPTQQITGYSNSALQNQIATGAGQGGANIISGTGGANIISSTGRNIADTYSQTAQMNAQLKQAQQNKPSVWQTLGGMALGAGTSLGSAYLSGGLKK